MTQLAVDAVVLDIDGVLVDVADSYRKTIVDTVQAVYGDTIPKTAIQAFKNAGGFNNDWELTDAAALYVLARRVGYEETIETYTETIRTHGGGREGAMATLQAALTDSAWEMVNTRWTPDRLRDVFQQLYLGADRYREVEGGTPDAQQRGYIENETVLIDQATIDWLQQNVKLGVLTGRPQAEAQLALDRVGLTVPASHQFTMDDWTAGKPDPGALKTIAERLHATRIAFVGDTIDDINTARNADTADPDRQYIAIGVLTGGLTGTTGRETFMQAGAKQVLVTVNELTNQITPTTATDQTEE